MIPCMTLNHHFLGSSLSIANWRQVPPVKSHSLRCSFTSQWIYLVLTPPALCIRAYLDLVFNVLFDPSAKTLPVSWNLPCTVSVAFLHSSLTHTLITLLLQVFLKWPRTSLYSLLPVCSGQILWSSLDVMTTHSFGRFSVAAVEKTNKQWFI